MVLGTESSSIYILDPEAFTIMDSLELPSPPVFLSVTGLYDVEFRILVTCRLLSYHSNRKMKLCRDGALCLLKRGWPSAKLLCQLDSQPVGLLRREKNIIIACMDQTLMCLTNKGKRVWQQKLPSPISCILPMEIPSRGLNLIAVALSSSHVLIYDDKNVVDCFQMDNPVSAMKFGKFGREDNTLVLVTVRYFNPAM